MKAVNEVRTSVRLTLRDTPSRVSISPKTTQGWRPISVNSQPKQLAASGSSGRISAARSSHRLVGVRPRRCAHRAQAAMAAAANPKVIMRRKVQ
ncbi:hypothetical protein GCM10027605_36720 [Micromonospora zhanjiangensis]